VAAQNWIRGLANPFHLAEPPKAWLRKMALFDPQLVIFPSQKRPLFVVARRCKHSRGIQPAEIHGVEKHPDTVICANKGLVPVTVMIPGAIWDDRVFKELAARDIERHGGADGMSRKLEAQDDAHEKAVHTQNNDQLDAINHDAYRAMKYRSGQRVSMAHKGSAVNRRTARPQIFDRKPAQESRIVLASS
jgi:hypothetical protein